MIFSSSFFALEFATLFLLNRILELCINDVGGISLGVLSFVLFWGGHVSERVGPWFFHLLLLFGSGLSHDE